MKIEYTVMQFIFHELKKEYKYGLSDFGDVDVKIVKSDNCTLYFTVVNNTLGINNQMKLEIQEVEIDNEAFYRVSLGEENYGDPEAGEFEHNAIHEAKAVRRLWQHLSCQMFVVDYD